MARNQNQTFHTYRLFVNVTTTHLLVSFVHGTKTSLRGEDPRTPTSQAQTEAPCPYGLASAGRDMHEQGPLSTRELRIAVFCSSWRLGVAFLETVTSLPGHF